MSNTLRHAGKAEKMEIRIQRRTDAIRVFDSLDDGQGFVSEMKNKQASYGLARHAVNVLRRLAGPYIL